VVEELSGGGGGGGSKLSERKPKKDRYLGDSPILLVGDQQRERAETKKRKEDESTNKGVNCVRINLSMAPQVVGGEIYFLRSQVLLFVRKPTDHG